MRIPSHPDSRSGQVDVVARRLEQLRAEMEGPPASPDADGSSWEPSWWDGPEEVDATQPLETVETVETVETATEGDPLVPVPGRHASRRSVVISPDAVLPEPLRGRVALGPWHLVVIAGLVAVALAVTCWWLVRADPEVVPASAAAGSSGSPGSSGSSASPAALVSLPAGSGPGAAPATASASGSGSAGTVTVDVEGKVHRPGIVVLPTGSRVVDAIKAAGGATQRQVGGLNQAAVLTDGQQIVVGAPAAVAAGAGAGGPVSLNAGTLEDLDTLPGVGPVTAQAILDWREQNGGFTSVDELMDVDGIGPKTFEKLKPMVTL